MRAMASSSNNVLQVQAHRTHSGKVSQRPAVLKMRRKSLVPGMQHQQVTFHVRQLQRQPPKLRQGLSGNAVQA